MLLLVKGTADDGKLAETTAAKEREGRRHQQTPPTQRAATTRPAQIWPGAAELHGELRVFVGASVCAGV